MNKDIQCIGLLVGPHGDVCHAIAIMLETDRAITIAVNDTRPGDRTVAVTAKPEGFTVIELDDDELLVEVADRLYIFHVDGDGLSAIVTSAAQAGKEVYEYPSLAPGLGGLPPRP